MTSSNNSSLHGRRNTITILDGSFRKQFKRFNLENSEPMDLIEYNKTKQDYVRLVHLDFLCAGANVIRTNTFQASVSTLIEKLHLSVESSIELITHAVLRAKEAVDIYKSRYSDRCCWVVGSCGSISCSKNIQLYSNIRTEFKDYHRLRIQALVNAGVDALALESIESTEEAYALVELLREFPNTRAWMSFNGTRNSFLSERSPHEIVRHCYYNSRSQIFAVGDNCGFSRFINCVVNRIKDTGNQENLIPIVMYPQNLYCRTEENKWDLPFYSEHIEEWFKAGLRYLGGCCNVNASDIQSISEKLDTLHLRT